MPRTTRPRTTRLRQPRTRPQSGAASRPAFQRHHPGQQPGLRHTPRSRPPTCRLLHPRKAPAGTGLNALPDPDHRASQHRRYSIGNPGRGGRSPASPALWVRWVTMAASTPLVRAGGRVGDTGRLGPGPPWANWVTGRAGRPGSSQDFCPPAASSSRPSVCRSRASRARGMWELQAPLAASGSPAPLWRRARRRPRTLRRPQTRRPPGPGDVLYGRCPP
jgi:hypothetical protein